MQAGIFEYGTGVLAFNAGGSITATDEYLPNPYQITYNNIPIKSGVTVTSMTKTDWQGTYTLSTSSRTNLAIYSEDLTNGNWGKVGATAVTGLYGYAPDGNYTANRLYIPASAGIAQLYVGALATATFSIWIKSNTGASQSFRLVIPGLAGSDETATTSWQRFTITGSPVSGQTFGITNGTSNAVVDVQVWGAQFETGSSATAYIPTVASSVTATDYSATSGGVVTLGTNYWAGQYKWTGTGTLLPYCVTGPTNRYNRMSVGISGLAAETVSMYPSYDGQVWESNAIRPLNLATGALFGSVNLANGTYKVYETPWKGVLFMASAATSGSVRYSLLNAN